MRRNRLQIWTDLLVAVRREAQLGLVTPSRVQSRANLPYGRFRRHLDELHQRGLLERDPLRVTPLGHDFLRQCAVLEEFLQRFGLADESPVVLRERLAFDGPRGRPAVLAPQSG